MDDAPPGVPEWVVTYGDMMSLLLTFFIMLVSLSEVVADQKYQAILDALLQYVGYETAPASPPGRNFALNSLVETLASLGSFSKQDEGRGGVRRGGVPGESPQVLRTREGVPRRAGAALVFAADATALAAAAETELAEVVRQLAGKPNKIDVRGHAGSASSRGVLVLSYERAKVVAEELVRRGVERERLRVSAVGDSEPDAPSGDRHAVAPDRVEVLILDAFATEFVGPRG